MIAYHASKGDFSVKGKVAIITGAAQGIGKATAELLVQKGARVILMDLNLKGVQAVADGLCREGAGQCIAAQGNITDPDDVDRVVDMAVEAYGEINILCNIAGIALVADAENLPLEYWEKTMAVNAMGPFLLSQRVGRQMIRQGKGGKIITVASDSATIASDRHVAYCASKAAVVMMTKVLALEWGKHGINVNTVSPTVVLTEMGEQVWKGEAGETLKHEIPAGRFVYPDEVAASILFLASDESMMITGENLMIDGALSAH